MCFWQLMTDLSPINYCVTNQNYSWPLVGYKCCLQCIYFFICELHNTILLDTVQDFYENKHGPWFLNIKRKENNSQNSLPASLLHKRHIPIIKKHKTKFTRILYEFYKNLYQQRLYSQHSSQLPMDVYL
jgi:hypothetical protein